MWEESAYAFWFGGSGTRQRKCIGARLKNATGSTTVTTRTTRASVTGCTSKRGSTVVEIRIERFPGFRFENVSSDYFLLFVRVFC